MSQTVEMPTEFVPGETDPDEWIRENREFVEREANSDGPAAWVFQSLLNSLDESSHDVDGAGDEEGSA